jgi:putative RNA 2'-phosphotransferase
MANSRFLSLILRHQPEIAHISLDEGGWVEVSKLLLGCAKAGRPMAKEELEELVATNPKRRFEFSDDRQRIRACQGHSVAIELGLAPRRPPAALFHGSAKHNLASILRDGLHPGSRQHVHLSDTLETALTVGRRHGEPVVLQVDSGQLHRDGFDLYLSTNGVWLTELVPPRYLTLADNLA